MEEITPTWECFFSALYFVKSKSFMNYHVDHVHTLSRAMELGAFSVIIVLSLKTSKDDVIYQIKFMNRNKPLIIIT